MKPALVVLKAVLLLGFVAYVFCVMINVSGRFAFRKSDQAIRQAMHAAQSLPSDLMSVHYRGGQLRCAFVGNNAARPAVIFSHGSPGALDAFLPYLEDSLLASHANLYSYDRPGFGQTTPKQPMPSLARQAEALKSLVVQIGAPSTILVGHSMGCPVIARFAMDYPGLADGLIMIAAPADANLEPANWWRYILEFPPVNLAIPRPLAHSNTELRPLKRELRLCETLWGNISCPVTIIHGENDGLVPVDNVPFIEGSLDTRVEQATMRIEDEGHFILWTHVDAISEQIIRMLDNVMQESE